MGERRKRCSHCDETITTCDKCNKKFRDEEGIFCADSSEVKPKYRQGRGWIGQYHFCYKCTLSVIKPSVLKSWNASSWFEGRGTERDYNAWAEWTYEDGF